MAVTVKKFRVRAGDKVYVPGEVISNLPAEEEARLIAECYCDPVIVHIVEIDKNAEAGVITEQKVEKQKEEQKGEEVKEEEGEEEEEKGPNTDIPLKGSKGKEK